MQPVIVAPVPIILFANGEVEIHARYRSEFGAPMTDAQVGIGTSAGFANCSVTVEGEEIYAIGKLSDLEFIDETFTVGSEAIIQVRTCELENWSETQYKATTAAEPTVTLASGVGSVSGFPYPLSWSYEDYEGYYQCQYELRITGSNLMGEVVINEYSNASSLTITGKEIAFGAKIGGTNETLHCELEVWSTSGLSTVTEFDLTLSGTVDAATPTGVRQDFKLAVEAGREFFLYALVDGVAQECGYSSDGYLLFDLPIKDARYFAVTLNSARLGRADEVVITGEKMRSPHIDYPDNGVKKRITLLLENESDMDLSNDVEYVHFAGRSEPVGYYTNSETTMSVSAYLLEPMSVSQLLEQLKGREAVYRPSKGGIHRVFVDKVSYTASERSSQISGRVGLSLTKVDGSPYGLFYESPFFTDAQLYPSATTYPSSETWMVG